MHTTNTILFRFLITIFLQLAHYKFVNSLLKIDLGKDFVLWDGCILRKSVVPKAQNDPCYQCVMTPGVGKPVDAPDWNQKYVNCTDFCDHITVCTEAKYYTTLVKDEDPVLIPVCYQCENTKWEEVSFELIRDDELCSSQCEECAGFHDISTATECSKKCLGLPTFCYPVESWFNHRKCYRASFWYGCKYKSIDADKLSANCKECAILAKSSEFAQECAVECEFLPTYSIQSSSSSSLNYEFKQCIERPPASTGDFLYYEIPYTVLRHMHVSNPGNLYPFSIIGSLNAFIPGSIGKKIFRRFNMTELTWPKPGEDTDYGNNE